jgi:phosphohistidine phosphatase
MKTLYILRHAKSSWKDPTLADHQRPLNKRGKRNVPLMGKRLKARAVRPDRIVCSDARRALDTAIPIAGILDLDPAVIQREPRLYHASEGRLLKLLSRLDDRWAKVMIVGHNPGLTEIANRFLPRRLPNLPTAGIVELRFAMDSWQAIDSHKLVHSSVDFPKNKP